MEELGYMGKTLEVDLTNESVLGWKNLKAIRITGDNTLPMYDKEGAAALCRRWSGSSAGVLKDGQSPPS